MTTDKTMINKISDTHFEVGPFTVSMFNPNVSISWELTGPQMEPVMSDHRDTLLRIATYLVNVSQQADLVRELIKFVVKERLETKK
jgi:hypothetical protein